MQGTGETNKAPAFSPKNFLVNRIILLRQGLGGEDIGNKSIDISQAVRKISITESIYQNGINVDLNIIDEDKLLDRIKINGTEKIHIDISRNNENEEFFKLDLSVFVIDSFSQVNPGVQGYVIRCVSDHILENQSKTISQDFSDISKKIRDIASGDLNILINNLEISKVSESCRGIIPKMKPLSAINWLARNITDRGLPYYFYETTKGKVKLKSQLQMINDEYVEQEYINRVHRNLFSEKDKLADVTKELYDFEKHTIEKLNSKLNFSGFNALANGIYGSRKYAVDIYAKSYKAPKEYTFSDFGLLNKEKPFPQKFIEDKELSGRNFYLSLNSGAFDPVEGFELGEENYHGVINNSIQEREQYLNGLDTHSQEIVIPGDFEIEVGKTINLRILSNTFNNESLPNGEDNTEEDRNATGKYLITSLIHTFEKQNFLTRLVCKKDSFVENQDEPIKYFTEADHTQPGNIGIRKSDRVINEDDVDIIPILIG
tara:strand:- start:751 stop:2214 length:1464 start_codon:yes stop_codon:yes gene_type:complete